MLNPVVVVLYFLAFVGFTVATNNVCGSQPQSCARLPHASAKSCSSIISKSRLKISTCSKPAETVTRTITVYPKTTKYTTVTRTSVQTKPATVRRTQHSTAALTTTSVTTLVQTSTETDSTTVTVPQTSTTTTVSTSTSTITSTVAYTTETCPAAGPPRRGLERRHEIPRDCSCYLTTTKSCGKEETKYRTVIHPVATTVTRTTTLHSTVLKTTTLETLVAATSLDIETSTQTSTTSVTITEAATITSTATETSTSTSTTTSVTTSTLSPCSNADAQLSSIKYTGTDVQLGSISDSAGAEDCCTECYFENPGCVMYALNAAKNICYQYYARTATTCITPSCPLGKPALSPAAGDGNLYALAGCAGTIQS